MQWDGGGREAGQHARRLKNRGDALLRPPYVAAPSNALERMYNVGRLHQEEEKEEEEKGKEEERRLYDKTWSFLFCH